MNHVQFICRKFNLEITGNFNIQLITFALLYLENTNFCVTIVTYEQMLTPVFGPMHNVPSFLKA
jgi:hypothetical protein